ncbi:MAG: formate dehydrogenase, partial [FCB group bacterium]|nr:formate dehydrogenase [FCB group bacterium]
MLEKGVVEAVLSPADQGNERVMQTLISDAGNLDSIDPFAPVVPVNSAKLVSSLTAQPSGRPLAAVMRSCEVRALIELVKLRQADLDDIILIGLDCLGRYENTDYVKLRGENKSTEDFLEAAGKGNTDVGGIDISSACSACEYPVAPNVDLRLCVIGAEAGTLYLEGVSERGQAVLEKLELAGGDGPAEREAAVKILTTARCRARDQQLAAFRDGTDDFQKLQDHLAGCINCYNCRVA